MDQITVIHVPAVGEPAADPSAVTDAKIDLVISGLMIPNQEFSKAMAIELKTLRSELKDAMDANFETMRVLNMAMIMIDAARKALNAVEAPPKQK